MASQDIQQGKIAADNQQQPHEKAVAISPMEVFYSYSHKDEALRDELEKHLSVLKWQGYITTWYDRKIIAGQEWVDEIDHHLDTAHIILLLISPDFLASDYCYSVEVKRAVERHEQGEARVIPIILRAVYWGEAPFSKLQALPTGAKPITSWPNQDEALFDVAEGIRKAVEELIASLEVHSEIKLSQKEQGLEEGDRFYDHKQYAEAAEACEQALRLDPNLAEPRITVSLPANQLPSGVIKCSLGHENREGEAFCDECGEPLSGAALVSTAAAPTPVAASVATLRKEEGDRFFDLKQYSEALAAYEQALRLDPNLAVAYNAKGLALYCLKRYTEAIEAYEQALRLDPNDIVAYLDKSLALNELNRKEEAQQAYEKAREICRTSWPPGLAYGAQCYVR